MTILAKYITANKKMEQLVIFKTYFFISIQFQKSGDS